jgi:hypothetical protein
MALAAALALLSLNVHAEPDPIQFNRDVRPILAENCFYCHGQDANKRKAGLRLDTRDSATSRLESGETAIVPGQPDRSSLIHRLRSSDPEEVMPPPKSHRSLSPAQKDVLHKWIAAGAPYETHWAFTQPTRPPLPTPSTSPSTKHPIDRFILAKLEKQGLQPANEADRTTLLRRLSLDLTGLPPSPTEIDSFTADPSPNAVELLIDRLMASPHYGEKMALPWLDAARYADSNGFQQDGDTFQWMWRDWVVRSLNQDKPFDQFSIEQLAGDLLPNPTNDQLIATAFNRNHLLNGEGGAIAEEQRFNILFDRVDTTATTWLGLTLACAQCHDHKYDPLTMRDYYGLLDAFNRVSENGLAGGGPGPMRIAPPFIELRLPEQDAKIKDLEQQHTKAESDGLLKEKRDLAFAAWSSAVNIETKDPRRNDGQPLAANLTTLLRVDPSKRTPEQKTQLEQGLRRLFDDAVWPKISANDPHAKKAAELSASIQRIEKEEIPRVMIMRDDKPRDTFTLERGEYLKPKDKIPFATPAFLPTPSKDSPPNRLGLARWLFQPDHPLTARVQVNRIWQTLFGAGLVKTAEDLGVQSEIPLHRELLDWLAVEFRENGWSQKHIVRLIVTSATYRQSSRVSRDAFQRDPENTLLARGARFRAPSLILRDIALSASGLLDPRIGGRPVYPYQPDGIWETLAITKERDFTYPASKGSDLYRRSIYTFWRRTVGPANMFDASSRQTCKVRPNRTNTPLHALTTLNDPTWNEAARVLAAQCIAAAQQNDPRLTLAFRRVVGRNPAPDELDTLRKMLARQQAFFRQNPDAAAKTVSIGAAPAGPPSDVHEHAALSAVCLALFNLDEALTRE